MVTVLTKKECKVSYTTGISVRINHVHSRWLEIIDYFRAEHFGNEIDGPHLFVAKDGCANEVRRPVPACRRKRI